MATKQTTIDTILRHLVAPGDGSAKKMFGDYGIFLAEERKRRET
jgi:TfoX/Sxy family transcriptional regulator of competence genes